MYTAKKTICLISHDEYFAHIDPIFKALNILIFSWLHTCHCSTFVCKVQKRSLPSDIPELFFHSHSFSFEIPWFGTCSSAHSNGYVPRWRTHYLHQNSMHSQSYKNYYWMTFLFHSICWVIHFLMSSRILLDQSFCNSLSYYLSLNAPFLSLLVVKHA